MFSYGSQIKSRRLGHQENQGTVVIDKEIINFHIENGYFIKAQRMKKANGIFVEYPKSILVTGPMEPFISCYFVEDKKIKIMREKEQKEGQSKEIDVPNFAARTLIAEDILLEIIRLKLDHNLLFCFDKAGELLDDYNNLVDLLDNPTSFEDLASEKIFLGMLKDVLLGLDGSIQAEQFYLQDGYKIMKRIFDNGGICNV